jgi:acyl-CoA thioester hydrolase
MTPGRSRDETGETAVSPRFRLRIVTGHADLDELGHVSNLVYVRWVLRAAEAHSGAVGLDVAAYRKLGGVFVVRRHEIEYLAPCGDREAVALETWVESWGAAASPRRTLVVRERDGVRLARATTLWAFVSLATGRPKRILPEIIQAFAPP